MTKDFHHVFRITPVLIFCFYAFVSRTEATEIPRLEFPEAEWGNPNIIRIPFTLTGTLITVRGRVDTLEGNFFFDTGASGLVLNYRYFSRSGRRGALLGGGVTGR